MATLKAILLTIGFIIMTATIATAGWKLTSGEAQNLVFSTAFLITENIADSVNILGNSPYSGIVVYKTPEVNCTIEYDKNTVFSQSILDREGFREKPTAYALFTNYRVEQSGSSTCQTDYLAIRSERGKIIIEEYSNE